MANIHFCREEESVVLLYCFVCFLVCLLRCVYKRFFIVFRTTTMSPRYPLSALPRWSVTIRLAFVPFIAAGCYRTPILLQQQVGVTVRIARPATPSSLPGVFFSSFEESLCFPFALGLVCWLGHHRLVLILPGACYYCAGDVRLFSLARVAAYKELSICLTFPRGF